MSAAVPALPQLPLYIAQVHSTVVQYFFLCRPVDHTPRAVGRGGDVHLTRGNMPGQCYSSWSMPVGRIHSNPLHLAELHSAALLS